MKTTSAAGVLLSVLALTLPTSGAATVQYAFEKLDYPGSDYSEAFGINDAGVVVGRYRMPGDYWYARSGFIYDSGSWTSLAYPVPSTPPVYERTSFADINNVGLSVGAYHDVDDDYSGFTYSSGTWTEINHPDAGSGGWTAASGVNDLGVIVGSYVTAAGVYHGFMYDGVIWATVDHPGSVGVPISQMTLSGINNAGTAVGYYLDASFHAHAVVYNTSTAAWTPITIPGASDVLLYDINDLSQAVGYYISGTTGHGLIYDLLTSTFTIIDVPYADALATDVLGINNDGTIVGTYRVSAATEIYRSYIARAVPEPGTLALFGLGLAGIGAIRRKKLAA